MHCGEHLLARVVSEKLNIEGDIALKLVRIRIALALRNKKKIIGWTRRKEASERNFKHGDLGSDLLYLTWIGFQPSFSRK